MLYSLYEAGYYAAAPFRAAARATRQYWSSPLNPARETPLGRRLFASADLFANLTRRYGRPEWGIDSVDIGGTEVRVRKVEAWSSPWVKLTHFARDPLDLRRAGRTGSGECRKMGSWPSWANATGVGPDSIPGRAGG